MKNTIIFKESVHSRLYKLFIGKGAKVNLLEATSRLIKFLQRVYDEDPSLLSGDISGLLNMDTERFSNKHTN